MTEKPDEFELISRFFRPLATTSGALGLADDAAVLDPGPGQWIVVTTDILVAGVHFPVDEDPGLVAARLIAVNLSDLAAMGAEPWVYMLSLALPEDWDVPWIEGFAKGLKREQDAFAIQLAGGDTVVTPGPLTATLTAFGRTEKGRELKRSGAKAGDDIYVSGTIGDSALGLKVLKGEIPGLQPGPADALLERYHRPQPRVQLGLGLRELGPESGPGAVHGVIDISDGLVADLGHVARASGCAATIEAAKVPFSDAARDAFRLDPQLRELAVTGGDDYELLFTASPSDAGRIGKLARKLGLPLTAIGQMGDKSSGDTVKVLDPDGNEWALKQGGYRHF